MKSKKECGAQNFVSWVLEATSTERNTQFDENMEVSDKNNTIIKNKLISSLQYFFRELPQLANRQGSEVLQNFIQKKKKELFCQKYQQILENKKEEYSSLIYFKVQSQLQKFPHSIASQLMVLISSFYEQLLRNYQITIFQFFRFVLLKTYFKSKLDSNQNTVSIELTPTSQSKSVKADKIFKILYAELNLGPFYLLQNEGYRTQNLFLYMKQNQQKRNQKILKNIVEFSTKMKKKLESNRYRIFTRGGEPQKIRLNSLKGRISFRMSKEKQNIDKDKDKDKPESKRQIDKAGISIKPFLIRQKIKLKL